MRNYLNLETAIGAMKAFLQMQVEDQCMALQCNKDQLNLLTGAKSWQPADRVKVKRLLEQACEGHVLSLGLPMFELPAEFYAAVLYTIISPCNWFAGCCWLANSHTASELGNFDGSASGGVAGMEKVRPQQLFALLVGMSADERPDAIAKEFARKCNLRLGCLVNKEIEDVTKKSVS